MTISPNTRFEMAESKRPMFVALFITGCAIVILFKVHKFDVQRDVPWHLLKKTAAHEMSVQRQSPKTVVLVCSGAGTIG